MLPLVIFCCVDFPVYIACTFIRLHDILLFLGFSSQEEKDKWLEDLNFAISIANSDQIELANLPLPQVTPPANGGGLGEGGDSDEAPSSPDRQQQAQHR